MHACIQGHDTSYAISTDGRLFAFGNAKVLSTLDGGVSRSGAEGGGEVQNLSELFRANQIYSDLFETRAGEASEEGGGGGGGGPW
jgi:hypothetical protein